jgi:hypothetical protein
LEAKWLCLIWLKINIVWVDMEWHMSYLLWLDYIMCSFIGVPCVMSIMIRLFMVASFILWHVSCLLWLNCSFVISCILQHVSCLMWLHYLMLLVIWCDTCHFLYDSLLSLNPIDKIISLVTTFNVSHIQLCKQHNTNM